ncbi:MULTISPECIES: hypothetical protein [unclassified Bradyrhizobium]|uniref:hypothetical protein n=1 Tax=unclassified Bradyrhizobium TaxID=2631580 RepID=UPI0033935F40
MSTLRDVETSLNNSSEFVLPRSDWLRSKALFHLSIVEMGAAAKTADQANQEGVAADEVLRSSLAHNPFDPFLWFMLYSLHNERSGFDSSALRFLRQSYATGPLEGWIALRRNKLALAAFRSLPGEGQTKVVAEFVQMVDADFIESAAVNLVSVGWQQSDQLLAALADASLVSREAFARRLWNDGLKVSVPGVKIDERLLR